jgi:tetratricopeptide (TPR) repeat protein
VFFFVFLLSLSCATTQDFFRAGLTAMASGQVAEARADVEKVRDAEPANPQVWLALTEVYAMQKEVTLRGAAAERSVALAHAKNGWESSSVVRNFLGKVYLANGEYGRALTEYREAIRLSPYDEALRFDLAQALLGHEEFGPAADVLEDARKLFDRSAQIELALGVAYYGQRRFPEAVNSFLRTIELAPEVSQPYVFLGKMLDQAGDRLPEVERRFEEFERANPNNYIAYLLRAKALAMAGGDPGEIEKLLRKSIALNATSWEATYELGVLLESSHDYARAARELELSAKLNPDVAAVHYHLARVYSRMNKTEEAAKERVRHQELTGRDKVTAGMEPVR